MTVKNVVICAAGLGSRLGYNLPKCLVDIGNHKLIYYLLGALKDIENIRIVVGFKEKEVIDYVNSIRRDVLFVRNPEFMTTTNSFSLYLGSQDLKDSYLTVDGDMILDVESINDFIAHCVPGENLVGITEAKTEDAVFVKLDEHKNVVGFTRTENTGYEWSGIAFLNPGIVKKTGKYVYQELEPHLPLKSAMIDCFEIDTPEDLLVMRKNIQNINLGAI